MGFSSWEELINIPKKGVLFQVMLYAYALKDTLNSSPIYSGVIPLKNFENQFVGVYHKSIRNKQPIVIDSNVVKDFENILFKLLLEIFCAQKPFNQIPHKG